MDPSGRALFINMVKTTVLSWLAKNGLMTVRNVRYMGYRLDPYTNRHHFEYPVEPGESYFFYWSLPEDVDDEVVQRLMDRRNLYVEWHTQWHEIRKFPMNFPFSKVRRPGNGPVIVSTTDLTAPPNAITATVSWVYTPFEDDLYQNRLLAWRRVWRGLGTVRFLTSVALWRFLMSSGVVALVLAIVRWWTSAPATPSAPGC